MLNISIYLQKKQIYMKKIILVLCALVLLISCTSSSENEPDAASSTEVLLSRFENTRNGNYVENFTYNGNKLVKINITGNEEVRVTYSGNLISLSETFINNALATNAVNTYGNPNSQISERFQTDFFPTYTEKLKTRYSIPNSQGIVTFRILDVSPSGVETQSATGSFTINNGNLIKYTYINSSINKVVNYTYDSKKNARKNIIGITNQLPDNEDGLFSMNNLLTKNEIINFTVGSFPIQTITNTNYNYIYNANNYPVSATATETVNGGTPIAFTTRYFY